MTVLQIIMIAVLTIYVSLLNPPKNGNNTSTLITFGILLFLVGMTRSNTIIGLLMLVEHLPKIYTTIIVTIYSAQD